jgi:hypothetical protein
MVLSGGHYKEQGEWNNMAENEDFGGGGKLADKGGFVKVSYLEEIDIFTCIIKMFRKSNVHTQTQQMT